MENKVIKPVFYGNHRTRKSLEKDLGKLMVAGPNFKKSLLENNKKILEIGFGDGKSIIELDDKKSQYYYCVESYYKGILNVNNYIEKNKLSNIFLFYGDAVAVVEEEFRDETLDEIKIFFPDPWPKKKHHKRRILNSKFLDLISKKIKSGGFVKIATDWENYGNDIIETFEKNSKFEKTNDIDLFKFRPITKFEKRGITLGHKVFELSYKLK